ncbi:MAG: 4-hydroxythreonine-4-phosphate dehydrogenase PdxA [Omnitrophica bacterium RIFCSPHIGHO2_02_FULL_46_11]|nr:MAG: 4-hydroxythreonine-4-phosphate dehydrogenase PdxA [Omnitrophica bacterium RIFCSPLOWO2_01_FULL_45_10b]OGW86512.1 MAG: 4-hydroxythreonine-4-phosphate dehydrogenase PdxA [Omnitrophica bacterium RIFCSPHIGHO2_02_FULL_46_11]
MKPIIAITMGDPGGIGPEIILKSLAEISLDKVIYMIIGSEEVFQYASERSKIPFRPHLIPTLEQSFLEEHQINFLDITREAEALYKQSFHEAHSKDEVFAVGEISKWNAVLAFSALKVGAYQGACGLIQGLVTAPLHKSAIRLVDPKFLGHTEYLAKIARVKEFAMMFVSDRLRVTLATIHLPLKKVSSALETKDILSKISLTDEFLKRRLKLKRPKIGVAALNPHGKEFGTEDEEIIAPAVQLAQNKGIEAKGPLSGDQVFHEAYEGRLDAVLAMYHDQGLAPFKMIAFREGVNVTLGLPYIRTSPDHGTAFDIAYQNKAFPTAFLESIRLIEKTLTA